MFTHQNRSRGAFWRAACLWLGTIAALASAPAFGQFSQIVHYEGNLFPEEVGWQLLPAGPPQGERSLEDGWLVQTVRLPDGWPEPTGEYNFYRTELDWLVGVDGFFVEWRAITDNPAWIIDKGHVPTVASAAGRASSWYHITFSEANAAFFRDPVFPLIIAETSVESPHTYRVEVFYDLYIWYVDGIVIDLGVPEGPYPDPDAFLIWGAGREYVDASTAWDYVRTGRIPDDASGDYDSNGYHDMVDYYFVAECLSKDGPGIVSGPGDNAGPGCRFSDFPADGDDPDGDVDLRDFAALQNLFSEFDCVCCDPFCDEVCCP
jgi:hypothetical protein